MALTDAQKAKLVKLAQLAKFKEHCDETYQATISDLSTIRSGASAGATAYQKPTTGIPSTDLAQAVQNLLTAAGTALQASDLTTLEGKVQALEAYFSSEADSDNIINKWNEIVAFLANITESQTLDGIVSGINDSIAAKYTKPGTGIPETDLAQAVKDKLAKADRITVISGVTVENFIRSHTTLDNTVVTALTTFRNSYDNNGTDKSKIFYIEPGVGMTNGVVAHVDANGSTFQISFVYDNTIYNVVGNASNQWSVSKIQVANKSEMGIVAGTGSNADKTTITLKSGTSATVLTAHQDISGKVDKVTGKGLSTNDFDDTYKAAVDALVYATDSDIVDIFV